MSLVLRPALHFERGAERSLNRLLQSGRRSSSLVVPYSSLSVSDEMPWLYAADAADLVRNVARDLRALWAKQRDQPVWLLTIERVVGRPLQVRSVRSRRPASARAP